MRQEGYSSGYRIAKGGLTSHKQVCLCVRACAFRLCTRVFFVSVLVRACVPVDCAGNLTEHKQGYVHAVFGQDHHISRAVAALGTMCRCVCAQLRMCRHETHTFAHVRMMPTTPCALKCRYARRAILECVCCMHAGKREAGARGPKLHTGCTLRARYHAPTAPYVLAENIYRADRGRHRTHRTPVSAAVGDVFAAPHVL